MDNFIESISNFPNGTILFIELLNGLKIKGELDTIYETDNGLEMDDLDYQEYYACTVEIQTILYCPSNLVNLFKMGSLIEVSIRDEPLSVSLVDRTLIWSRNNN